MNKKYKPFFFGDIPKLKEELENSKTMKTIVDRLGECGTIEEATIMLATERLKGEISEVQSTKALIWYKANLKRKDFEVFIKKFVNK